MLYAVQVLLDLQVLSAGPVAPSVQAAAPKVMLLQCTLREINQSTKNDPWNLRLGGVKSPYTP